MPDELIADQECGADEMLPYEELLGDAMAGNQTWFAREDYVEEAWRIIDPILDKPNVYQYQPGIWGPAEQINWLPPTGVGQIPSRRRIGSGEGILQTEERSYAVRRHPAEALPIA